MRNERTDQWQQSDQQQLDSLLLLAVGRRSYDKSADNDLVQGKHPSKGEPEARPMCEPRLGLAHSAPSRSPTEVGFSLWVSSSPALASCRTAKMKLRMPVAMPTRTSAVKARG
jgi:hypothetical protein